MSSHGDIAGRWADVHAGTADKFLMGRSSRVFVERDKLYSYGTHFELARFVRPKRGTPFYLLNGDTYSVTTSRHQADTRAAVSRHADKFPSMIVPHSALDSAGIDKESIVPVDIEPERNETTTHRVTVPGLVKLAADALAGTFGWDRSAQNPDVIAAGHCAQSARGKLAADDGNEYSVSVTTRGWDYFAPSVRACGACEGTGAIDGAPCGNPACESGTVTTPYGGAFVDYDPPLVSYYRGHAALRHVEGDTFEYDTHRHFLGAAVFRATVTELVYTPCQSHGDNGRGYCDSCGFNVDNAPVAIRAGEAVRFSDRAPMVETRRTRRAYFLSAFDRNERHPHYFLAELPARDCDPARTVARPSTVWDAFRYLMPEKVRTVGGEAPEGAALRQGDIFAVPAPEVVARHPFPFRYVERNAPIPLDGSGRHVVTELVKLTSLDGRTVRYFGRGRIVHESGTRTWSGRLRGREHGTLKLGDTWHELVKNLVPMSRPNVSTANGRFGRNAPGISMPRSWSIIGNVD
jgi:hypothetical protein